MRYFKARNLSKRIDGDAYEEALRIIVNCLSSEDLESNAGYSRQEAIDYLEYAFMQIESEERDSDD